MGDQVFFTADLHLDHTRVLQYSKRPFSSVDDMNEALIRNWNNVVRPGDRVYVLGDFSLSPKPERTKAFLSRLVGQKFLVRGNHDEGKNAKVYDDPANGFVWVRDIAYIPFSIGGETKKIALCHFALLTWRGMHKGSWMLHGHSHGSLPLDPTKARLDVGVDAAGNNYAPVSLETIAERMSHVKFVPVDHHGED